MTKKQASELCSRYIRLRDALDYCARMAIDLAQFSRVEDILVKCCTCTTIKSWIRMQAGHYFGRGLGGGSGAYFDERNINTQCPPCNGFRGGNHESYTVFMQAKYSPEVIDELHILHAGGRTYKHGEFTAIGLMYKQLYNELVKKVS